jgi:hypothetical protein
MPLPTVIAGMLKVIISGATIGVTVYALVAVTAGTWESVTEMVKFAWAGEVGIPLKTPVEVLRVIPAGRVPADTPHNTYGLIPPLAAKLVGLLVPTVIEGVLVVMASGAMLIVMANTLDVVRAGIWESVT